MAWGPNGARGAAQAWNPRTGTYASTRQGSGVYGSWGSTHVQRGDDWAHTRRVTNRATGKTTRVTRTDDGGMVSRRGQGNSGFVGSKGDNVYAGRDGNVYRRDGNGSWNKYENGSWNNVQRPGGATAQPRTDRSNDRARQAATTSGQGGATVRDRAGQSGAAPARMDRSTFNNLERDRVARSEGAQRTRDFGNYRNSGGGNAGSFRTGGLSGARSVGGFGGRRGRRR